MKDPVAIKLSRRADFGRFCVALRDHGVSFSLAGHQTVLLTGEAYAVLPPGPDSFLKSLEGTPFVEIMNPAPSSRGRKRPAPQTEAQTEHVLRDLTRAAQAG